MRPTIAHVVDHYLPRTQTFIYGYLTAFSATRPAVFTHKLENLERFPMESLAYIPPTEGVMRVADRLAFSATGRRPFRDERYRRVVSAYGASVIHGHFGWSAPVTLPLKRDLGLPLVTTFYGMDMSALPEKPEWARLYRELFERGDLFFVEGGHMRERLVDLGCPAEKIRIQHIGVDVASIPFAERNLPPEGPVRVLMCASFVEKKGLTYGLEAFARAARDRDARLVLAGDGPLRSAIERCIDDLGIRGKVDMLGYVDHARFLDLAAASHLFMTPSVTASDGDTEGGAPTTLLEAQASGLPVLSTLHADIPEAVLGGRSGYLVPERDAEALTDRLGELIDHPETWPRMGREGREHITQGYDLPAQARRIEDVYLELMN